MTCIQNLFEIGAEKRLTTTKIYLKDTSFVQLLHKVKGLGSGELAYGGLSG